jgi:hypothetical protein
VLKNFRLSEIIVSDILGSGHAQIVFDLLDHVRIRNLSGHVDKFADLERFQRLASELILPTIQGDSGEEVDKATRDFTAPIASAHRLSKGKLNCRTLIRIHLVWRVC